MQFLEYLKTRFSETSSRLGIMQVSAGIGTFFGYDMGLDSGSGWFAIGFAFFGFVQFLFKDMGAKDRN